MLCANVFFAVVNNDLVKICAGNYLPARVPIIPRQTLYKRQLDFLTCFASLIADLIRLEKFVFILLVK